MAFRSSDSFADECLQSINRHRAKHQVSPLRLNAQISRVSQRWADGLARSGNLRHNDSAKHNGEELGENIAMRWSSDGKQFSGEDFVDQWYDEVKNYDFRKCSGNKTGHFTQLVWKGSAELGVGKAIGPDGKWMVVTNFYPAGNFLGEFQNNVFPPADGKITLKVSAPANAPGRASPRPTANDFPHTTRPSASPFIERQEVRRSPQQPTYVVTAPQSRNCNSPSTFSFLKPSASSSSSSTPSPFKTTSSTAAATASSSTNNSTFVQRQVRTEREGGKTRTIVIETFRNPDGSTKTIQTESTSTENGDNDIGQVSRKFGAFQLNNNETSRSTAASARAVPAPAFSSFQSSPSPMSPWSAGRSGVQTGVPSSGATSRFDGIGSQATSSGGGGGSSQREFNDDVIRNHNQYRRMHGAVGDLRLNNELCVVAQQWAERLASGRILQHSGASFRGKPMGENLACKYGTGRVDYTGKEVVKGWYDEIKDFNFRYPESSNLQAVGHFTQVVWKGSQEVGIGKAKSSDGAVFVVCNYIPAGNVIGRFKENVFPAK